MRAGPVSIFTAGLVGSMMCAAGASPPTSLYLIPKHYAARTGDTLHISLKRGMGGGVPLEQDVAFETLPSEWFFFRVASTQENRDSPILMNDGAKPAAAVPVAKDAAAGEKRQASAVPAAPGKADVRPDEKKEAAAQTMTVSFPATTAGAAMVGCDFTPRVERVPVADLLVFLKASLTTQAYDDVAPLLPTQGDVRVRRIETVKAFLRITTDDPAVAPDTQTATSKVGQVNEIRFMFDPTATPIGSDVAFRVFADYDKVAKARVTIACDEAKVLRQIESDATGTAKFTISHEGAWRVEFHHAKVLKGDADADIILSSATVTFHSTTKEAAR